MTRTLPRQFGRGPRKKDKQSDVIRTGNAYIGRYGDWKSKFPYT